MSTEKTDTLPLEGIKVLDLTRLIPGAFCTAILADAGADIIKIEELRVGDYERQINPFIGSMASRFLILNRNKISIALNLKKKEGKRIFHKLVKTADVMVEGFRPGAMEKLGLDYASVQKINSKLVYCSISSFGQDGPYRDVVAHDINILGMAGFFDVTGIKDGPPVIPGVQIADSIAGMNAALSIIMALFVRQQTTKGQFIDISMFDGVLSWLFDATRYAFAGKKIPGRGEGRLWGGFPNYSLYETKDGKYITVGSLESKFKNALLKELGREDFVLDTSEVTTAKRSKNDDAIEQFLTDRFLTKTRDEWVEQLSKLNICIGPVNSVEEAISHPQTIFRKMVTEVFHPSVGNIKQLGSPFSLLGTPADIDRLPAPLLGEQTKQILAQIGYGQKEINEFVKGEIVK